MLFLSQDWPLRESMYKQKQEGKDETKIITLAEIKQFSKNFEKDFLWYLVFHLVLVQGLSTLERELLLMVHLSI